MPNFSGTGRADDRLPVLSSEPRRARGYHPGRMPDARRVPSRSNEQRPVRDAGGGYEDA
jgi:hypothetical protein